MCASKFCSVCLFLLYACCTQALCALAETAADQLAPYSSALANLLLAEVSGGRLWEGKEVLLAAIGALGAACASTLVQNPGELLGKLYGLPRLFARLDAWCV